MINQRMKKYCLFLMILILFGCSNSNSQPKLGLPSQITKTKSVDENSNNDSTIFHSSLPGKYLPKENIELNDNKIYWSSKEIHPARSKLTREEQYCLGLRGTQPLTNPEQFIDPKNPNFTRLVADEWNRNMSIDQINYYNHNCAAILGN